MTQPLHAQDAGQVLPTSDKARGQAGQVEDHRTTDDANCAARAAVASADKAFATLRATLACHGFELHIVAAGAGRAAYMVHRWCLSCTLPDLAAVRTFAQRAGVPL